MDAVVAEAIRDGTWWLSRSRSRNRLNSLIRECLPDAAPICSSEANDIYLWKPGNRVASSSFSTADTWAALHPQGEAVFWHRQVWFQGRIPKHAFITWMIARNRLGTRDIMRSWGLQVPATCILCNVADETCSRIHNQSFRPAQTVIFEMKQIIKARLDPLSRVHTSRRTYITLFGTWLGLF